MAITLTMPRGEVGVVDFHNHTSMDSHIFAPIKEAMRD